MTHDQIIKGLVALGFDTGWVVSGDDFDAILWTHPDPKPTAEQVAAAAVST